MRKTVPPKKNKKVLNTILLGIAGVSIIFWIFYYADISLPQFISLIAQSNPVFVAGILIISALMIGLSAMKWRLIVRDVIGLKDCPLSFFYYYTALGVISGYIVPQTIGIMGTRSLSLTMVKKAPVKKAMYTVLLDQLFDWFILALILIPSMLFLSKIVALKLALCMAGLVILAGSAIFHMYNLKLLSLMISLYRSAMRLFSSIPFLRGFIIDKNVRDEHMDYQISKTTASKLLILALIKFFASTIRAYLVVLAIGVNIGLPVLLLCMPVAQMALLLGITPASLGVTELGWLAALLLSGVSKFEAVGFLASLRIFSTFSFLTAALFSHVHFVIFKGFKGQEGKEYSYEA